MSHRSLDVLSTSSMDRLSISQFELEQATFEVRFQEAYLHWDRAGAVWSHAKRVRSDLELVDASPGRTVFRRGRHFELAVQLDRINVTAVEANEVWSDYLEMVDEFVLSTLRILEVNSLDRVGSRFIHFKKVTTKEAAAVDLQSTGLFQLPARPLFGVKNPKVLYPEIGVRFEGPSTGVTVKLKAEGRRLKLSLPLGAKKDLYEYSEEYEGIVFDIDCFTTVPIDIGKLGPSEWLERWRHVVRRDCDSFLSMG